ncbi:hypothetical protein F5Y16DRAFT_371169 [Xylariaceae sp. FL0255]|nr:hypothetical protein F5Y16DRAFT_371169 [Xylariaceae sp. FL0255]
MIGALDIIGLALNIFPLLITLLEHYEDGYNTLGDWVFFRREFVQLMNSLNREQIIFRQHIEVMLRSIIDSEYELSDMMDDASNPGWSDPKLTARLKSKLSGDGEYANYNSSLEAINACLVNLQSKLERCGPLTDATMATSNTIKRLHLHKRFRKLQFALRKTKWQEQVENLGKQIDRVSKLFGEAEALAPARQSKPSTSASIFKQTKTQASSLHRAISMSWKDCSCEDPHAFKLIMMHRSHKPLSKGRASAGRELKISFPRYTRSTLSGDQDGTVESAWSCFNTTMITPAERPGHHLLSPDQAATSDTASSRSRGRKSSATESTVSRTLDSRTAWSQDSGTTLISTISSATTTVPDDIPMKQPPILVKDLCHSLQTYQQTAECLGYLHDGQGAHHIFNYHPALSFKSAEVDHIISLASILDHTNAAHAKRGGGRRESRAHGADAATAVVSDLTRAQRMSVALSLAYAVLELYPTPWLPRVLGKEDVYFFVRKDGQLIPESPFLLSKAPSPRAAAEDVAVPQMHISDTGTGTAVVAYDHSDALLGLGIIIMELWFGQPIESLPFWSDHCDEKGQAKAFTSFTAAIEWQKKAIGEAGIALHDVTYRCIRGNVGPTTIDLNDSHCVRAVFDQVIKPLEGLMACFWPG